MSSIEEQYNLTAGELPKGMKVVPLKDMLTILQERADAIRGKKKTGKVDDDSRIETIASNMALETAAQLVEEGIPISTNK